MISPEAAPGRQPSRTVGKGPVVGSACVHTVAILLVWWASAAPRGVPDFPVFEIELISPTAAEFGEPTPPPPDELVITMPLDPAPERQEEIPALTIEEDTQAADETPQPEATVAPRDLEPVGDPESPTSLDPDPEVETPGEDLNVRMEGLRRDHPEYHQNIISQMDRCFQTWRGGGDWRATIYFVINRDGSVSGVDIPEPSGNIAFDVQVMGAAECAGRPGKLGPLPEDLPYDQFGVVFWFEGRSR